MTQPAHDATNDTSPEPKSFDRCGPFVIDYKRCYSGFGTAVKHNGVEYIVVCHDHSKLEEIVTETLSARIEAGFFRVIVAPESKAKPLVAEAASIPSAIPFNLPLRRDLIEKQSKHIQDYFDGSGLSHDMDLTDIKTVLDWALTLEAPHV